MHHFGLSSVSNEIIIQGETSVGGLVLTELCDDTPEHAYSYREQIHTVTGRVPYIGNTQLLSIKILTNSISEIENLSFFLF